MTPLEQKELLANLESLIDRKLAPVLGRVAKLEGVDAQHDRAIKDARRELTYSKTEIVQSTTDVLLAAARHNAGAIDALAVDVKAVKESQTKTVAPAAESAKMTGYRVESKALDIEIAQVKMADKQQSSLRWMKAVAAAATAPPFIEHVLIPIGSAVLKALQ